MLSAPSPAAEPAVDEPPAEPQAADAATPPPAAPPTPRDLTVAATIVAFVIGCAAVVAGYVAINGGVLRAAAPAKTYEATRMTVPRGLGRIDGNVLAAHGVGGDVLIVAIPTDFRARDLETIAWDVTGVPANADVRLLFNSDYTPRRVHNRPLVVEDDRVLPIALAGDRDWLGRITGLALAVRAPGATVRVRSVTAKPLSLAQLLKDRARRVVPRRALDRHVDQQRHRRRGPADAAPSDPADDRRAGRVRARRRGAPPVRPRRYRRGIAPIAVLVFVIAWVALDLRWTANLARQVVATLDRYGGKDTSERALAAEDGELAGVPRQGEGAAAAAIRSASSSSPQAHYFRGPRELAPASAPRRVGARPRRRARAGHAACQATTCWCGGAPARNSMRRTAASDSTTASSCTAPALLVERGSALFAIR